MTAVRRHLKAHLEHQIALEKEGEMAGRPREFDEGVALEAAIDCFTRYGYEATSVRDLSDRMKISGPSLYNAFGDKRALFLRAVELYQDQNARSMIKRLERSFSPKEAVLLFSMR